MSQRKGRGRRIRQRSCESKHRHATEDAAYAALRAIRKKHPDYPGAVYECDYCRGWHVGRSEKQSPHTLKVKRQLRHA